MENCRGYLLIFISWNKFDYKIQKTVYVGWNLFYYLQVDKPHNIRENFF